MVRRGRARLWTALFSLTTVALCTAAVWLYVTRDLPPITGLMEARQYLNLVRQTAREDEATPVIQSADENLNRAQAAIDAQYRRLVLFRNYDLARYHVKRARELGAEALETAKVARQNGVVESQKRLVALRRSLKTTKALLSRMSLKDGALTRLTSAEAKLNVAAARLTDHETREVRDILNQVEEEMSNAAVAIQGNLEGFLSRRATWDSWVRETIACSQRGPAVLIDKLNHQCYVLRGGRVVDSYPVDLGGEWMSWKIREGDRATPEGRYSVTRMGGSRFYKAALLSYPNESDRSRFVRAKREGKIPRSARIGGLIEIHGEGGRGMDWTAGCISLSNRDIDSFLRQVRVGTPVTIVGVWQEPGWLQSMRSGSYVGDLD